jgi:hypothetical protein
MEIIKNKSHQQESIRKKLQRAQHYTPGRFCACEYLFESREESRRDEPERCMCWWPGNLWRKSDKARWKIIAYGASCVGMRWAFWVRDPPSCCDTEYINWRKGHRATQISEFNCTKNTFLGGEQRRCL